MYTNPHYKLNLIIQLHSGKYELLNCFILVQVLVIGIHIQSSSQQVKGVITNY